MNDPMEAFYEVGGRWDLLFTSLCVNTSEAVTQAYKIVTKTTDKFGVLSFSDRLEHLPMWAYYASNFGGMCLKFDTDRLPLGDLQNESLSEVTYATDPLPPLGIEHFLSPDIKHALIPRFTRKRVEWAHEHEWRYLTGATGPKHYIDDALIDVYLGPRTEPEHASRVCDTLKDRPTRVHQGRIQGYTLTFDKLQKAASPSESNRTGEGRFIEPLDPHIVDELSDYLDVPLASYISIGRDLAKRPNAETVEAMGLSRFYEAALLMTTYRLRNGRRIYSKTYLDSRLQELRMPPKSS